MKDVFSFFWLNLAYCRGRKLCNDDDDLGSWGNKNANEQNGLVRFKLNRFWPHGQPSRTNGVYDLIYFIIRNVGFVKGNAHTPKDT